MLEFLDIPEGSVGVKQKLQWLISLYWWGTGGAHMPLGLFTTITLARRKKPNLSWNKHNYFFL